VNVDAWLKDLNLEALIPNFRENDIDADVLPLLTAEDLHDLGVTKVGQKRKLLAAIAKLSAVTSNSADSTRRPAGTDITDYGKSGHNGAERRHLTVMFVVYWRRSEVLFRLAKCP